MKLPRWKNDEDVSSWQGRFEQLARVPLPNLHLLVANIRGSYHPVIFRDFLINHKIWIPPEPIRILWNIVGVLNGASPEKMMSAALARKMFCWHLGSETWS